MKWEEINMEFMVRLPRTQKQHESIWLVVDRLTKSAYFIPVYFTYTAEDYARIYIYEIVSVFMGFIYPSFQIEMPN